MTTPYMRNSLADAHLAPSRMPMFCLHLSMASRPTNEGEAPEKKEEGTPNAQGENYLDKLQEMMAPNSEFRKAMPGFYAIFIDKLGVHCEFTGSPSENITTVIAAALTEEQKKASTRMIVSTRTNSEGGKATTTTTMAANTDDAGTIPLAPSNSPASSSESDDMTAAFGLADARTKELEELPT